ncbi:hypothetical protein AV530_011642 [Patagioenas fasciata monilis]|uniref:Uncharacterized protein n=1 Tax=Patagioenas fasciata monilis TaxID=372326 RepID=A0A1V4J5N8_PATFA|nr:hypothetical protein AV530_011642 [Patagioenas fasciata monilis]
MNSTKIWMEECSEESDQCIAYGSYINKQGTMLTLCDVTQLFQLWKRFALLTSVEVGKLLSSAVHKDILSSYLQLHWCEAVCYANSVGMELGFDVPLLPSRNLPFPLQTNVPRLYLLKFTV